MKHVNTLIAYIVAFLFSVLCWIFIISLFTGCTTAPATATATATNYQPGTIELISNTNRRLITWSANYDTITIYGQKMSFKIMPATDQIFGAYYQDSPLITKEGSDAQPSGGGHNERD